MILKAAASAPGKVILTGEHFVVFREPALVMAINRYVYVNVEERKDTAIYISSSLGFSGIFRGDKFRLETGGTGARRVLEPIKISAESTLNSLNERRGLNIHVTSTLPVAAGLGSSGASAVSTVAAVGKLLEANFTKESIVSLATSAERYVHNNPSGVDQSISTYGGIISYKKGEDILHLKINSTIPIVIGNTSFSRNSGKLVDGVQIRKRRLPEVICLIISAAGKLTTRAIDALKRGDLEELGLLMDINHGLLTALGVSNEALDKLVYAAKRGGALGAKLTGAGGGGCIIALTYLDRREDIAQLISEVGGIPIFAEKVDRGVRSWKVK
ncbi:MAG: mevalonate kinase [Candidatus Bathyarchaeota archaeon]